MECVKYCTPKAQNTSPRKSHMTDCPECEDLAMTIFHDDPWFGNPGVIGEHMEKNGNDEAMKKLQSLVVMFGLAYSDLAVMHTWRWL